jgi:polyphosphate kinase
MKRMAILRGAQSGERCGLLQRLRDKLVPALRLQADCFRQSILPGLAKHGVALRRWDELTPLQQQEAGEYFDSSLSPALTPLVIDVAHPFPFIANLSTSLTFRLHDPVRNEHMYARVKVPAGLQNWVPLSSEVEPGGKLFIALHEIIRGNVHKLYGGMTLTGATVVRLTRDADVELDEDPETELREAVEEQVRQRRYEPAVRLEFGPGADAATREMLRERFELSPLDVYDMPEEVDYTTLFELMGLPFPELRDPSWTPLPLPALEDGPAAIFSEIQAGDILVHHPYESFDSSVEHFIAAAADDPQTISIKMTAYRIGDDTPFVKSLIRAAERGKQVACVMEIKARFDEERNLHWAEQLESVGAHVTFGVRGLKTHGKTALVVRRESSGLRCYVHIGTGNYHVKTARLYADFGLLTCNPLLTRDVVNLFHYLTGHAQSPDCRTLLVAPDTMRRRLLELIEREIGHQREGRPARIVAKMNQLEDPDLIAALCRASVAGVSIDLIIRGFCCLKPGVTGKTENIRVRSIIGRFLEHSRVFHFTNGAERPVDGEFFIGSADWMVRNLSKRVEIVTPVLTSAHKEKLWEFLDICLKDMRQAWVLGSDGNYSQLWPDEYTDSRDALGTHRLMTILMRKRAGA